MHFKKPAILSLALSLGLLAGCGGGSSPTVATPAAPAFQKGDTLIFTAGKDSAWVWWSLNQDLDKNGTIDQALGVLSTPGFANDSIMLESRTGATWARVGAIQIQQGKTMYMLVSMAPPGTFDFAVSLLRPGLDSIRATASATYPALLGVHIGGTASSSSSVATSSSSAYHVTLTTDTVGGTYAKGDTSVTIMFELKASGVLTETERKDVGAQCVRTLEYVGTWAQAQDSLHVARQSVSTSTDCTSWQGGPRAIVESPFSVPLEFLDAQGTELRITWPDAVGWVTLSPPTQPL